MTENSPKVIIKEMPVPNYPKTYSKVNIKYENILKKRSLKNIKGLNPIFDPGVFQSDTKTIEGIKAFIIKGNNKKDILDNYKEAFKNNDFYIFPYFEYNYNFSVDKDQFILSINKDKQVFVNSNCLLKEKESNYFEYNNELYNINDFKSYDDDLIQIYLVNKCFMVIFYSKVEIDGFFNCQENFNITDYKVKEIKYLNKEINEIKAGQFLVYEVKNGDNLTILLDQMIKKYYFLMKFFDIFTKYNFDNFVYLGFYRNKVDIKIEEEIKNKFEGIQIPSIILRYEDSLFGESLYFDEIKSSEIEEIKLLLKESGKKIDNIGKKFGNVEKNTGRASCSIVSSEKAFKNMADNIENKLDNLISQLEEIKNLIKNMPSNSHNAPNNAYINPYNIYNPYVGNYSVPFTYASPIIIYYPYPYPYPNNIQPLNNNNINNSKSDSYKDN